MQFFLHETFAKNYSGSIPKKGEQLGYIQGVGG